MRDAKSTSEMKQFTHNGGRDANYLVRSWASSLGAVTQGHKTPKSGYRSTWLQRLNRMELMQNVEVQQSLRNMMNFLKASDEIMQDSDSAFEFAERKRAEKCREAVRKIRESELLRQLGKETLKSMVLYDRQSGSAKRQDKTLQSNKECLSIYNKVKTSNLNYNYNTCHIESHKESVIGIGENDYYFHSNDNDSICNVTQDVQVKSNTRLPPIPEATQEKYPSLTSRKVCSHQTSSFPELDATSKFSIIRKAKEIRHGRISDKGNQSLSSMSSHDQVQRKFSKAKEEPLQINQRIEIFANNHEILNNKPKHAFEKATATLPFLDSKSFMEIDCNDYLNINNRFDSLSPVRAVLDHKLHWPARSRHK